MVTVNVKKSRLEARVSQKQKEEIQRAADLSGCTLSDFLVASAHAAARETIRQHYVMELTERGTAEFVALLMSPPQPSERMRAAARVYLESVERK